MTNDIREKLLREQADKLAAEMLRTPLLAVDYRDALVGAAEDSNFEGKLVSWFRSSGFTTNHAHLADALVRAPGMNLAYWDGFYLLRVDDALFALDVGETGVVLNGVPVSGVTFDDGVLRFSPSELSPWNGELTFADLGWHGETSLASATVFQRSCKGRVGSAANRPEAQNAAGGTARVVSERAASATQANRVMKPFAATVDWSAFLNVWSGTYAVTWTNTPEASNSGTLKLESTNNTGIKLTFTPTVGSATVTSPTTSTQNPPINSLAFNDGTTKFNLTFQTYGDSVRGFTGTICASGTTAPQTNNAFGSSPQPKDNATAIAIGLGAPALGLAILIPIIAYLFSRRDADQIKDKFTELNDIPEGPAKLFEGDPKKRTVALEQLKKDYKKAAGDQGKIAKQYSNAINQLVKEIGQLQQAEQQLKVDLVKAQNEGDQHKQDLLKAQNDLLLKEAQRADLEKRIHQEGERTAEGQRDRSESHHNDPRFDKPVHAVE
jgi:hypothetical protein